MSEQDNLRTTRNAFDAWNAQDPDRYVTYLDEKWIAESDTMPAPVRGHAAAKEFMSLYVTAFPDLHFDIDQMLANGEFVVTRWTATGTHRGPLMGIPPTNRKASRTGATSRSSRMASPSTTGSTGTCRTCCDSSMSC